MDKLSEHAIRMLEIADANDIPVFGNNQIQDISRAVYDIILQVQMLKTALRKTENCSEKPNNCDMNKCYKCTWWNFTYGCKSKYTCEFEPYGKENE